ncbi:MAG: hypothetical protein HETSPECPRED_002932 [Heterodermia speciosa]|uniref:Uncharacterized protein n=1 Tax=Heterodermia speciosa TaxID=116794 RepID=A0A8H3II67_9LECA|nr:MAG: hypothetical protein HETSPECPRED_002932 [Heterodermia speciosa]
MLLSIVLRVLGLTTVCGAATIQPFLRLDYNGSNKDIPPGLEEELSYFPVDPRFSIDLSALGYDISDKSMYMTGLKAMRELSRLPFDSPIADVRWSYPQYGDIEIALVSTNANLEAKQAMWSIFKAMFTMGRDQFRIMRGIIFWTEPGQPRHEIGKLFVLKGRGSGLALSSKNGTHHASKDGRVALTRREADSTLLEADSAVTTSKNDTTSLKAQRNRNLKGEFEGPTLSKLGVFICIYGGILGTASAPRPFVGFDHASLDDEPTHVELEFNVRPDHRPGGPPKLEADDIVYMLYSIPKYMYNNNRFRAGQFVLLVNDVPLLQGFMGKTR